MKPIMSLAEKWNPSRRVVTDKEIKSQYKSKTNSSKPNTEVLQQTKHRGVYQKKKKKNPQYTNQNQTQ